MAGASPNRLPGIEALRGLAAAAKVLSHSARHVDKAYGAPGLIAGFQAGHAGVDLFFVISGFIILYVHWADAGRPGQLAHYAARRFTRIMPLYWVALAVTLAMAAAGRNGMPSLGTVLWSAALLPSVDEPFLGIAWTLQYELVFYVAFAALVVSRVAGKAMLGAWLLAIVAGGFGVRLPGAAGILSNGFGIGFFLGMAAAWLVRQDRVVAPRLVGAAGAGLFVVVLMLESVGQVDGFAPPARLLYGVPALLLVAGIAAADRAGQGFALGRLRRRGTATYSIYLFQFVFIGVLWQAWLVAGLGTRVPHWMLFAVLAAAALGGGMAVSRTVEQPMLRWMQGRRSVAVAGQV